MKKILTLAILATTLFSTSCVKNSEIFRGESMLYTYRPSNLRPTIVGTPINGVAVIYVNGKNIPVQCVTPTNPVGDVVITDPPMSPTSWEWFQNNGVGEYRPSGMTYNSSAGFSSSYCKGYFVEIYANGMWVFHNGVSLPWLSQPNPAEVISSFDFNIVGKFNYNSLPYVKKAIRVSPTKIGVEW
ncbi:hypothetical protein IT402_01350 [Candidatus Nomurabacteria bacterium]|nr:hypothetical protein [Candidatus Nomurabacteria bacterium]